MGFQLEHFSVKRDIHATALTHTQLILLQKPTSTVSLQDRGSLYFPQLPVLETEQKNAHYNQKQPKIIARVLTNDC